MPAIRCSVAPMVARTDRHFRRLMRSVTQHTPLYTEMVVASSLVRGDEAQRSRMLGFDALERPLTLQLGGSIEGELCEATALARERGFDEVNLNVGRNVTPYKMDVFRRQFESGGSTALGLLPEL